MEEHLLNLVLGFAAVSFCVRIHVTRLVMVIMTQSGENHGHLNFLRVEALFVTSLFLPSVTRTLSS